MKLFAARPQHVTSRLRWTICIALSGAWLALLPLSLIADDDEPRRPEVPPEIEVPGGNRPFLLGHAVGTQNYICLPSGTGGAWTFFGPQATLFDHDGKQVTTHFLSANPDEDGMPRATWQHSRDTSAVWGAARASSLDPAFVEPGAIPWLLLQVVGAARGPEGGRRLTKTTYIHRIRTSGGAAPATGCAEAADVGRRALVPYTADYVFYRASGGD
jgi:hypothetical protein